MLCSFPKRTVCGCAVFLSMLAAPLLFAGPFKVTGLALQPTPSGSGARAMGQGNAFIGVADDATAASWNPAGLIQLEKPEVSFALEALWIDSEINYPGHPEAETTTDTLTQDLNYFSAVYPFRIGGRHAVVSVNWLRQFHFDRELEYGLVFTDPPAPIIDRARSFTDVESEGSLAVVGPAFALELAPGFSLGATLNFWDDELTGQSHFELHQDHESEQQFKPFFQNGATDVTHITSRDEFEVKGGTSVTLGALYRINRAWSVGLLARPPYELDIDHTRESRTMQNGALIGTTGPETNEATLNMPLELGGGVAWRMNDHMTISCDVHWMQWSEYSYEEGADEVNPINGQPIGTNESDDTVTCRLGFEYVLIGQTWLLPLRCGAAYEEVPAINEVDRHYVGSLGAGLQVGRYMFDIAYEARYGEDLVATGTSPHTTDMVRHRVLASLIVYF